VLDFCGKPFSTNGRSIGAVEFQTSLNTMDKNHKNGDEQFSIYPNPVSNHLLVQSENIHQKLELFNDAGCRILIFETNQNVEVGNLSPGIYYVRGIKNCQKIIVTK